MIRAEPLPQRRMVVALGGNALIRRQEPADVQTQRRNVDLAVRAIADLARRFELIVTHGNGPQVGLLSLQNDAYKGVEAYPLDVLGAETQGMIGYLIEQTLINALPGTAAASILTQVIVDAQDPAFSDPTKFVGPVYDQATAEEIARSRRWTMKQDGQWFRRVVPSPEPQQIVEIETIRLLLEAGVVVICSGGGGVPVIRTPDGLEGVEAVVDKDLSAALLAQQLGAHELLLLTDVAAVQRNFGSPEASNIGHATPGSLRALDLPPGSMGPKAEAAARFVEMTGGSAAIGRLEDACRLAMGRGGTQVRSGWVNRAAAPNFSEAKAPALA